MSPRSVAAVSSNCLVIYANGKNRELPDEVERYHITKPLVSPVSNILNQVLILVLGILHLKLDVVIMAALGRSAGG